MADFTAAFDPTFAYGEGTAAHLGSGFHIANVAANIESLSTHIEFISGQGRTDGGSLQGRAIHPVRIYGVQLQIGGAEAIIAGAQN